MLERVEIESLVLRVPGVTQAEARELAAQIASELLSRLDGVSTTHAHLAELRVRMPGDVPRSQGVVFGRETSGWSERGVGELERRGAPALERARGAE